MNDKTIAYTVTTTIREIRQFDLDPSELSPKVVAELNDYAASGEEPPTDLLELLWENSADKGVLDEEEVPRDYMIYRLES